MNTEKSNLLLSICIPTNGISEWVFPVLNSIYSEKTPCGEFEVIVTDNGNNEEFFHQMIDFQKKHTNLVYKKTNVIQFLNQIEAFKLAKGDLIKFINHRMILLPGALNYYLKFSERYKEDKPGVYFMDGRLDNLQEYNYYNSFDDFVKGLSYWSSWSGGTAMWKSDFEHLDLRETFDSTFPHVLFLFSITHKNKYIINNKNLGEEIMTGHENKGSYDFFNAFAVKYLEIILQLYLNDKISSNTFIYIKDQIGDFLCNRYIDFIIRKKDCSYDLSSYNQAIQVFYSSRNIFSRIPKCILKKARKKLTRRSNG
ncbi:MAG: hypothetical protein PHX08_11515 [Lachnospiraceae bacterium]|nr:hypothetical protein [Lachnospiraceae bacterium]